MTNLEKLRTGTDEEVLHLMQRFAYRSLRINKREASVIQLPQMKARNHRLHWRL